MRVRGGFEQVFDGCSIHVRKVFYNGIVMANRFDDFFKNAQPVAARKLEPYAALIRQCRRQRWSFRRIAAELKRQKQISVAPSTVWEFLQSQTPTAPVRAQPPPEASAAPEGATKAVVVSKPFAPPVPPVSQPEPPTPGAPTEPTPNKTTPRKLRFNPDP